MMPFSEALRTWRKTRRYSQLELAIEANVSARHISFLESGRARPSQAMVARLGDALHLPLSARNQMLTLAGFAMRYPGRHWNDDEMMPIRAAVDHMLSRHAPYPALAADRLWNVVRINEPARRLFGALGLGEGDSLLDLLLSSALLPLVENWPDVAHRAAQRLRTESAAQGGLAELERVAARLSNVPAPSPAISTPVVPTIFRVNDMRLSLFATISQFGTPEDLTLDDLKIELYFPADALTETTLRAMEAMAAAG